MYNNKNGFTLIELLVVIAIIGLLITIGTISLINASARARDSVRLGDVRNISKILSLAASDNENVLLVAPCNVGTPIISTCVGLQPGAIAIEFPKFNDPSGVLACDELSPPAMCDYTIRNGDYTVGGIQVLFYLERSVEGLAGNQIHWVDSSGAFDQ